MKFKPQPLRRVRYDVVKEALEWVDTPFVWQQSLKGVGCDCKGLVVGVALNCGFGLEACSLYAQARDYKVVKPERLLEGMESLFDSVEGALPGDVLVMNLRGRPQHMGIITEADNGVPIKMVHTYNSGPMRVRNVALVSMVEQTHSLWAWRDRS